MRRERRGGGTPRLLLLLFQVNELTRFVRGPSGAPACWGRGLTLIHGAPARWVRVPGNAVRRLAKHTKGSALVIPLLPPRARERGAVKLPHTHERRLFWVGVGSRVRFARASVRRPLRVRRAGGAAPDPAGSGALLLWLLLLLERGVFP